MVRVFQPSPPRLLSIWKAFAEQSVSKIHRSSYQQPHLEHLKMRSHHVNITDLVNQIDFREIATDEIQEKKSIESAAI